MSSLSLPRVLQQRKTSLEQERENFEKFQSVSISKALNTVEHPVKEKHVRSAILGTFHEKSSETFWACVLRLPLQENRIVAWKFCHVLHKVLREGHAQVIPSSYRHISMINDLGRLWGHLKEGYGRLIQLYCSLLAYKLRFHKRNPRIPGNLALSTDELDAVGENDINNFFQLSVEMFDYMDEILTLQAAIFGSLDMSRSNSMTSCGQCRLAPLIPVIQDSSQLYDTCVKILFRLHASLPPDVLAGHRDRFLKQFKVLRNFYFASSALQYFKNLIQIPTLPENPPNFLIQSELRSYVTPVVVLPPEEPLERTDITPPPSTGELVDLATPPPTNGTTSPDLITERDSLIEHLQNELSRYRAEVAKLLSEHQATVNRLQAEVNHLETQLAKMESELVQERLLKEDLLQQTEVVAKFHETEKKAKAQEEKFQKLKEIYSKLREEHIQLIRQKADVDKQLLTVKSAELDAAEKQRLESLAQELATLQVTADTATEQNQALESKLDFLTREKKEVESELQDLLSHKEDLDKSLQMALKEVKQVSDAKASLYDNILNEAEDLVKRAIHEVDNPLLSSATCSLDYLKSVVESLEKGMAQLESSSGGAEVVRLAHITAGFILHVKAVSNTAPDIELGDQMAGVSKKLGEECVTGLRGGGDGRLRGMRVELEKLLALASKLEASLRPESHSLADLIEHELAAMDTAINEAVAKMQELLSQSRAADSGIKLEVNEKILDSCTGLMQAILILVRKAKILQAEIVAQGKGSSSAKEFYKRNHQWTEGLISAAKAVGMGAKYLLDAADDVVSGRGKFEFVIAAAQEISGSTAQLVVASRVKAERGSASLGELQTASRGVTNATATVVSAAKSCVQLVDSSDDLDISGLDLHNTKRREMESQVRVLELESLLEKERLRLSALRKKHYALAPDSDQLTPPHQ